MAPVPRVSAAQRQDPNKTPHTAPRPNFGLIVSESRGSSWLNPAIDAWILDDTDSELVVGEARVEVEPD